MLLQAIFAASTAYILSTGVSKPELALNVSSLVQVPIILFGGFFVNSGTIPKWIRWLQYLSPIKYGMEAMVWNEFGQRKYSGDEINMVEFLNYQLSRG